MDEKKNILVVDDDEAISASFKAILQAGGYSVDTANTGREAIEKSKTKFYSLALFDIRLPDMEGTKLLVQMHETAPKMMKIMVTGYPSLENAVESVNLGADAYVIKPVKPDELLKVVEKKLKEQGDVEKMTEEKVAEWVKTRIRKLESKPKKE
ncbi:MAG: response regulator [Candidatus Bathyarchaeota archaeon]